MNDIAHKQATQASVKARFRGNQKRICKTKPLYPQSVEREFQRITNAYMKLLNTTLKKHLPEIQAAACLEEETRQDGIGDLLDIIRRVFAAIGVDLEKSTAAFGLRHRVERMANLTRKLSIREWKRAVHATLGIDILEDYYMGEFYREALTRWVDANVALITTIPKSTLGDMENIVMDGFRNGRSTASIIKEIQQTYNTSKSRARLLARDQLAKLNGELSKQQQQDAGVEEYIWSDSDDVRVRKSHRALNGKRFRWDNPPIVDAKRGRCCHPGQDYQCRCVALPIFDIDTINLPLAGKGGAAA